MFVTKQLCNLHTVLMQIICMHLLDIVTLFDVKIFQFLNYRWNNNLIA